ncbi:MAG: hypothetical protein AAFX07_17795, partial [Pseudomonadota bacterium]
FQMHGSYHDTLVANVSKVRTADTRRFGVEDTVLRHVCALPMRSRIPYELVRRAFMFCKPLLSARAALRLLDGNTDPGTDVIPTQYRRDTDALDLTETACFPPLILSVGANTPATTRAALTIALVRGFA